MKRIRDLKAWLLRYERHLSSLSLITGFIVDSLTLKRIDLLFENLVLFSHLVVAGTAIVLINLYEGGALRGKIIEKLRPWLPLVNQFSLGALFSGFLVFYSRSGSLVASWPFLFLLVGILIGNELFRKYYIRLTFQMSVYFLALFSFSIFYLPIILNAINAWVFVLSGLASLAVMALYLYLLTLLVPARMKQAKKLIVGSIGTVFILINIFYFTNILPPIPLSLKEAGAYYYIARSGEGYLMLEEDRPWYRRVFPRRTISLSGPGEPVYVFSAVFAPTDLSTNIIHDWQYYDEVQKKWTSTNRVQFPISGGRDGGYRGYSVKSNATPGKWRVNIETLRGQLIGRTTFYVEYTSERPVLQTTIEL
ncbi:MAG: DUF2914 domain-containing protein [bacterium]|nr:DUF2914 domain-containing protein [bacterium]